MCGGGREMRATTSRQLEATRNLTSVTPIGSTTRTRVTKNKDNAARTAVPKAIARTGGALKEGEVAGEALSGPKRATRRPKSLPVTPGGRPNCGTKALGVQACAAEALSLEETRLCNECAGKWARDKASGTGSTEAGSSDQIKALTEAGKKRLVNKLLGLADTQATQGGYKITPADLIRLMQLHREMNPQKDRKVTVQWIEDEPE